MTTLRVAAEGGDGFHAPSLEDFFPSALWADGSLVEFNRVLLVRLVAALALVMILVVVAQRAKVVPSRGQSVVEMLFDFVRVNVVQSVLGEKDGKQFEGLLIFMFLSIFAFNVTGIIPGLNIASTGLIGLPLILALVTFVTYLAAGIRRHGVGHYLKNQLLPPSVPKPLLILMTPIDFLQVFLIRPASLTVRLTVNMLVGHLLLALTYTATEYFWHLAASNFNILYGLFTFIGMLFMTVLELFVAALQAYIFAMLSAVYINMATAEDH